MSFWIFRISQYFTQTFLGCLTILQASIHGTTSLFTYVTWSLSSVEIFELLGNRTMHQVIVGHFRFQYLCSDHSLPASICFSWNSHVFSGCLEFSVNPEVFFCKSHVCHVTHILIMYLVHYYHTPSSRNPKHSWPRIHTELMQIICTIICTNHLGVYLRTETM